MKRIIVLLTALLALFVFLPTSLLAQGCLGMSSKDYQLGLEVYRQEVQQKVLYDPDITALVEKLGNRVLDVTGRTHCSYAFTIVRDPNVNAFALPGGFVSVTLGLLQEVRSEEELLGVLAHEIGHTNLRHAFDKKSNWTSFVLGAASEFAGKSENKMIRLASLGGQVAGVGLLAGWSRDHERDADTVGIQVLMALGLDLKKFAEFFDRLPSGSMLGLEKVFGSHPSPKSRAKKVRDAAQKQELPDSIPDQQTFQVLKEHLEQRYRK